VRACNHIMMIKKYFNDILNFLPGVIILLVSLIAISASVLVVDEHKALNILYEEQSFDVTLNSDIQDKKQSIGLKHKLLYWSVWSMGLAGFVLVLMNIDKMRRLKKANAQAQDSLELLEKQLEDIQKAETDKTALREQLHQAQKLEAVGRLAGGIAHDFNNILAAMNGYAEFLTDDLDDKSQQYGFAKNILAAGQQARELVDKMLAFSRRDVDEMQNMRVADSVQETVSMLKASLPKTIDMQIEIDDENHLIHGSQTMISQALMNLCVNAKDAMPNEKGRLMVSASLADMGYFQDMPFQEKIPQSDDLPLVDIMDISPTHTCLRMGKLARDQEYICLSVADDGSGMTRVIMENIFEPFFTTKSVDEGTGLGLAMVHGVVANHKGAMQINSIAGKGTRFDILFPSLGEVKVDKAVTETKEEWKAVGNVLVVDDQDNVRAVSQTMLERNGFEVESCDCAKAALEIIKEHPDYFSVIVTDHNMPEMTGLDLIEEVSNIYPDLPFVLVTGYSPEGMGEVMEENNALKAIIKKPIDRDELAQAVQNAILEKQFAA